MSPQHQNPSPFRPACPQCQVLMNLHNTRIDATDGQKAERRDVYLCIRHGFFHVSESQPLRPGM